LIRLWGVLKLQIDLKESQKYVVELSQGIMEIFQRQEEYKIKTVIVIDKAGLVLGTVSDGDLRRFYIKTGHQASSIYEVLQKNFFFVHHSENIEKKILAFDLSKGAVPIVNKGMCLIDVYDGKNWRFEQSFLRRRKFTVIAPTRISFAGGGSDVADWFKKEKGKCINAAIDLYARVNFEIRDDDEFNILSINTGEKLSIKKNKLNSSINDNLILNCIKQFPDLPGLNLEIYCDFSPGSGLGGSSSLCVAILMGCAQVEGVSFSDSQLRSLAYAVERYETKILGGWQDQIAAVSGGLNISTFDSAGIKTTKLHLSADEQEILNGNMLLFPIGAPRSSSGIHAFLAEEMLQKKYSNKMKEILKIADQVESQVNERQFNLLGKSLDKGWQLKRKLSDHISNDEVDNFYEKLISFGASGGRLLGAGSSGFLLMFVELTKQPAFIQKCVAEGVDFKRFKLDMLGARVIGGSN
jgi:D-glycero-alpha-D-manno-heptose-7-phosphate kinase